MRWIRHKILLGESLGVIAKHYKTTIDIIKQANSLYDNKIQANRYLLIPILYTAFDRYFHQISQNLDHHYSNYVK